MHKTYVVLQHYACCEGRLRVCAVPTRINSSFTIMFSANVSPKTGGRVERLLAVATRVFLYWLSMVVLHVRNVGLPFGEPLQTLGARPASRFNAGFDVLLCLFSGAVCVFASDVTLLLLGGMRLCAPIQSFFFFGILLCLCCHVSNMHTLEVLHQKTLLWKHRIAFWTLEHTCNSLVGVFMKMLKKVVFFIENRLAGTLEYQPAEVSVC